MVKGWFNESRRHSLASRGIKTMAKGWRDVVAEEKPFATGESLEEFLDTPEGQEYLEEHFEDMFEVPFDGFAESEGLPYWIDNYENYLLDYAYTTPEGDELIESVSGYWDQYKEGDIIYRNGKDYYYISGTAGSGEMELQADNDELIYWNIGSNFFRIWKPVPKTHITLTENGKYQVIHKNVPLNAESSVSAESFESAKEFAKKKGFDVGNVIYDSVEDMMVGVV